MNKDFYFAIQNRRSIYGISEEVIVSQERIQEIVNHAVLHAPSAFNSQSARVVLLFGENHHRMWDITKEALRRIVPAEKFAATEKKINAFRSGYGTIMYFEDMSIVEGLQQRFPTYKEDFPIWSQHASGMVQYIIWTSLELEGLGASLQHYGPLIEEEVKQQWSLPASWKLIAQMPFGKPTAAPGEKQMQPIEERVRVFK